MTTGLRERPALASTVLALWCGALGGAVAADAPVSSRPAGAESPPVAAKPLLLSPTQGRPLFVEPGGVFRAVVHLPRPVKELRWALVAREAPGHRQALETPVAEAEIDVSERCFTLRVPADVPEATYDLEGNADGLAVRATHAVSVAPLGRRVRLVHLSDMNVGDLSALYFDERLVAEVNLFDPTLIVVTGDLLDATHPDPADGWQRLCDFLSRFHAPAVVACGDHEDLDAYTQFMAPSPIGVVEVGDCRGLILYDLPGQPVTSDEDQLRWVQRQFVGSKHAMLFAVAHDECPNLLRYWQDQGSAGSLVRAGRLGLWFSGGHRDWDGQEYRGTIDAAAPMMYVRTHAASTVSRDGAEGVSHYRVLDVENGRATVYGELSAAGIPASIPVGRLRLEPDSPNDGTRERLTMTATSTLPFRVDRLAARVLLRRMGDGQPWCRGAQLERCAALGQVWECWLRFDLPDKGSLEAVVGCGAAPDEPAVEVRFEMPPALAMKRAQTAEGVACAAAADFSGSVRLRNTGERAVEVGPLLRLDGELLAYRVAGEAGPLASVYRLRLAPQQMVALQPDLTAVRVAPGRRELQVYLKGGSGMSPACWPLDVTVSR